MCKRWYVHAVPHCENCDALRTCLKPGLKRSVFYGSVGKIVSSLCSVTKLYIGTPKLSPDIFSYRVFTKF